MQETTETRAVLFDLETIADPSVLSILPPVEPKANLKDPEKIKSDIAEKEAKRLSELGLDITTNMICCISYNLKGQIYILTNFTGDKEKVMLENFWMQIKDQVSFVSFNGNEFDVPVLMFRSMLLGVTPLVDISPDRYCRGNHKDLRAIITNFNKYQKGTQDFLCKRLGCNIEPFGEGSQIQEWYDNGEFDKITTHCQIDIKMLEYLYLKMKGIYF